MRLFIAVDLSEEVRRQISELQKKLVFTSEQAKCTPSKEQHITLKFIGEVSDSQFRKIKNALKTISFQKFNAKIETNSSFANEGYLRVAWFIAEPEKEFLELYKKIDLQLRFLETKKVEQFIPHVTLARFKYVKDRNLIIETIKSLKLNAEWSVNSFKLIESNLTPQGPVYKILEEYKLN